MKRLQDKINYYFRILKATVFRKFIHFTRKIIIPGFEGVSLWEIVYFFVLALQRGFIATRASALAFHFFLAMIPFGLVMVIITAYIPYFNLEHDILPVFGSFIPETIFNEFTSKLSEFHNSTVNSLISYGFILALYFSSNGFSVLINSFNASRIQFQKRSWWSVKITSLIFVFLLIFGLFVLVLTLLLERKLLNFWAKHSDFVSEYLSTIYYFSTFLFVAALLYFAIAALYYFGPSKRREFRFFSAGSTLATLLFVLLSDLYSFYIQKFANYDELYGSLGTIMMLLLWIYLMSFVLLLGFELNASIHGARKKKQLDNKSTLDARFESEIHQS